MKKGKNNWRYILIVTILVAAVGIILWYISRQRNSFMQLSETNKLEEEVEKTKNNFLGKRILEKGMSGQDVRSLQERLKLLAFNQDPKKFAELELDYILGIELEKDYFGRNTKNAVINFQQVNSLEATGKVDSQTCKLLMKERSYYSKIIKYTVKEGDTLYSISKEYKGSNFTAIAKANSIDPSSILVGQELYILDSEGAGAGFQLIRKGDTVTKLAEKWKVSEEVIKRANCIAQDLELEIGEELYVPFKR